MWQIELLAQVFHARLRGKQISRHHFTHAGIAYGALLVDNAQDVRHNFSELFVRRLLIHSEWINTRLN